MEDPQARVQIKQLRAELAQLAELTHKMGVALEAALDKNLRDMIEQVDRLVPTHVLNGRAKATRVD